ncbi:MAG: hypothetical protein WCV99_18855 [Sterolibacterium sp.]|jgi:hypothetical protein
MNVIALPGRNQQTESWLRSVLLEAELPVDGMLRYRHWDSAVDADVDFEAERLANQTPALVIAKSLGTVIAATAFCLHQFRPQGVILIGTPYGALTPEVLVRIRQLALGAETLFIQQTEDPGGPASQIATTLQLSRSEVVSVPGDDHLYTDIAALAVIIKRWKNKAL